MGADWISFGLLVGRWQQASYFLLLLQCCGVVVARRKCVTLRRNVTWVFFFSHKHLPSNPIRESDRRLTDWKKIVMCEEAKIDGMDGR